MKLMLSIVYVAVLGILSHYIGESLPRSLFIPDRFPFCPFSFEKNGKFYERLGIRKWKTRVPDMSRFMRDMLPKRVTREATSESVHRLIKETCVAEFTHKLLCVFGIGIYFIWKNGIGIMLTVLFALCNTPFIMIQRYNRPHLMQLEKRLLLREEKKRRAVSDTVV